MIPLFRPDYGEHETAAVADVLDSGWVGLGPRTEQFEQQFAERVGSRYAVATNSCTAALHISLELLGIGPGDEVIVPTLTFVSTAHAVRFCGAKPVFCDVDAETLCINLDDAARKITPRTAAIIPVLYAGQPLDVGADYMSPDGRTIPLIYDAAHAAGSTFDAGGSKLACWSFHAVKNLACGDGGMLTTSDRRQAERARRLRWLGIDRSTWDRSSIGRRYWWEYDVAEIGHKSHMNDIAAAIGLAQLARLDEMQQSRRRIAERYRERLDGVVRLPAESPGSSRHLFVIRTPRRDELAAALREAEIHTGVHYKPLHLYRCYGPGPSLPVAEREWRKILSLPIFPRLKLVGVDRICDVIHQVVRRM